MNAATLLRTAQSGIPAIERTIGHLARPTIAQTVAFAFAEYTPVFAMEVTLATGQSFESLVIEDIEELVALYRSRTALPMEIGINRAHFFGATTRLLHNMGSSAPFNPAHLPSSDSIEALCTLHDIGDAILTALDYSRFSAN